MLVDITVANFQIRAARPRTSSDPVPTSDVGRIIFAGYSAGDRFSGRVYGTLRGRALAKARRLVNRQGSIGTSGEYGSLEVDDRDFVPDPPETSVPSRRSILDLPADEWKAYQSAGVPFCDWPEARRQYGYVD